MTKKRTAVTDSSGISGFAVGHEELPDATFAQVIALAPGPIELLLRELVCETRKTRSALELILGEEIP